MDVSVRNCASNVLTLQRMCGRIYVISRVGDRVKARLVEPRKRERPTLPGVVVPFPGR